MSLFLRWQQAGEQAYSMHLPSRCTCPSSSVPEGPAGSSRPSSLAAARIQHLSTVVRQEGGAAPVHATRLAFPLATGMTSTLAETKAAPAVAQVQRTDCAAPRVVLGARNVDYSGCSWSKGDHARSLAGSVQLPVDAVRSYAGTSASGNATLLLASYPEEGRPMRLDPGHIGALVSSSSSSAPPTSLARPPAALFVDEMMDDLGRLAAPALVSGAPGKDEIEKRVSEKTRHGGDMHGTSPTVSAAAVGPKEVAWPGLPVCPPRLATAGSCFRKRPCRPASLALHCLSSPVLSSYPTSVDLVPRRLPRRPLSDQARLAIAALLTTTHDARPQSGAAGAVRLDLSRFSRPALISLTVTFQG
ncbi:uncharacterized protein PSFLO_01962 [Pseudozyma flocculosa]|uniref:Uncharacterized protein n=1 Tax=Pseudozyma flocculosa TaxID=84751 RepID=A0A5C3EZT1_9BASI|nr:uncharacterized protein PSFLO_01962 [Pseudozyma flocculosa]